MIDITDKSKCCGCTACVQRCPKQCIVMHEDKEGFLYPKVDTAKCIDCGLCEKVCPVLNVADDRLPQKVLAAKNKNEQIRNTSSSGGIFTILAEQVINDGGVVFGVKFNDKWEVVHSYTETIDGLAAFRGSKYVQSFIGNSFKETETFLKQGRKVLFSGTPCQIAGLKRYLRKEYCNLLTVECACHGVPSPKVWREYLNEVSRPKGVFGRNAVSSVSKDLPVITGINFRDKSNGWKKFGFLLGLKSAFKADENSVFSSDIQKVLQPFYENPFMQAFLADFILRPSCYKCPAKAGRSGADIALADFWGIENILPEFDDDKGCSLVLDYTSRVEYESECKSVPAAYEDAVKYNSAIVYPVKKPLNRDFFFHRFNKGRGCIGALYDIRNSNLFMRAYRLIYRKVIE